MSEARLILFPRDQINEGWEMAKPFMGSFFEGAAGRYGEEDIVRALKDGFLQLWIVMLDHVIMATCMTEVMTYPKMRELRIIQLTGEHHELWVHLLGKLEEYARSLGCSKLIGRARPGWERIVKSMGYVKTHVEIEKDIGDAGISGTGE